MIAPLVYDKLQLARLGSSPVHAISIGKRSAAFSSFSATQPAASVPDNNCNTNA
jgi:hypothetical protein